MYMLYTMYIKYGKDYFKNCEHVKKEDIVYYITNHANLLSEIFDKCVAVNPRVLKLLLINYDRFGFPYCPCRFARTDDNICPCVYHIEELKRYGRCRCGLFKIVPCDRNIILRLI